MKQRIERIILHAWDIFTHNALTPWIPATAWMVIIFIGSSIMFTDSPSPFTYADKCVHFIEYGILGFLLYFAQYAKNPDSSSVMRIFLSTVMAGLYGLTDEIHQFYVPTREFSFYDLASDMAGALFFSWIAYLCQKKIIDHIV